MCCTPDRNAFLRVSNLDSIEHFSSERLERRVCSRQKLRSVAYIDLGPSNGGLVLNLSEAGLAFSSAKRLVGERLPALSFKLPGAADLIEAEARVVWISESKREAGVQFERLAEGDARRIGEWIAEEQGLHTQLREAAESAESQAPVPLPKEQRTEDVASRRPAKQRATAERPMFVESIASATKSSPWESEQAVAASAARKRRLAMAISLFAVIALLALAASLTDQRRANPTASKVGQAGSGGELTNNAELVSKTPDAPVTQEQEVAESKNEPSLANGSVQPTSASQAISPGPVSETAGENTMNEEPQPEARVKNSKLSEPNSAEVSPRKTEQSSSDNARKGATARIETPNRRPLTAADAKRLQEEAAAERALELASAKPPPSDTPDTTNNSASSDGSTAPASAASEPAKLPTGSVEVRVPSSPSMRITAELEAEATGEGRSAQMGQLISRVQPEYPTEALKQELQGLVKAHVAINSEGEVESVDATGPPLLVEAATAALRQWRYTPTLLNRKAIPADENVTIIFRLSGTTPK